MKESKFKITRRKLPHWHMEGSAYFITFGLVKGVLTKDERGMILEHLKSGSPKFYRLIAAMVMPDHVHIIIRPNTGMNLSRILKGIKGASARMLNKHRGNKGQVWEAESWDRIIRDEEEFLEKLNYMHFNPVKRELVKNPDEWDGWYYK